MNTIKLYKNPNPYPYYGGITEYKSVQATPRNQDLRSGYVDMQLTMGEILNFNYISFTRDGRTVYAWVENVEDIGGNKLWRVRYNTDPFRTYRNDLVLGNQYIERSPVATNMEDVLLGSSHDVNDYSIEKFTFSDPNYRWCVAQVRPVGASTPTALSNTPGQPSAYDFYFCKYDVRYWQESKPIANLIYTLRTSGESSNVVTVYSIPYIVESALESRSLLVKVGSEETSISGWKWMSNTNNYSDKLTKSVNLDIPKDLTKSRHSVSILFPEAGIMRIPTELLYKPILQVRQDVDLFSGACNYMLTSSLEPLGPSVRGSGLNTLPILSDPFDTYISQNQNTLAVGLIGDVANVVGSAASGSVSGTLGGLAELVGVGAGLMDAQNAIPSNPPAFLGSALVPNFNQTFYQIVVKKPYDNETTVRARYGYPYHKIAPLTIPSSGFIKTSNCSVSSNGSVPLWAINEINQLFNAGILFK